MKLARARLSPAAAVVAALVFAPAAWSAPPEHKAASHESERYRVVIQVSDADPAKWNLALNNARNIQADFGKGNVDIEIVAYGPGLPMLKMESPVAARLAQALDNDIGLKACRNTMRNTKVEEADMYGGIGYVASGVVHIMRRQREGWAYLRP